MLFRTLIFIKFLEYKHILIIQILIFKWADIILSEASLGYEAQPLIYCIEIYLKKFTS